MRTASPDDSQKSELDIYVDEPEGWTTSDLAAISFARIGGVGGISIGGGPDDGHSSFSRSSGFQERTDDEGPYFTPEPWSPRRHDDETTLAYYGRDSGTESDLLYESGQPFGGSLGVWHLSPAGQAQRFERNVGDGSSGEDGIGFVETQPHDDDAISEGPGGLPWSAFAAEATLDTSDNLLVYRNGSWEEPSGSRPLREHYVGLWPSVDTLEEGRPFLAGPLPRTEDLHDRRLRRRNTLPHNAQNVRLGRLDRTREGGIDELVPGARGYHFELGPLAVVPGGGGHISADATPYYKWKQNCGDEDAMVPGCYPP